MEIILTASALLLWGFLWWADLNDARSIGNTVTVRNQWIHLGYTTFILIGSLLLVFKGFPLFFGDGFPGLGRGPFLKIASVVIAFLISFFWYLYISWLDIYEKEKIGYVMLVFGISSGCTFLVFPLSDLIGMTGLELNGGFVNDLIYTTVRIGMVEEIVKFLPFLLILLTTRQVDESFDYILYGCVSALGFAFVENILYLSNYNLFPINGRSLYSSVAHMFDTSVICYFLAIAHYRKTPRIVAFFKGYILASLAHGFYDFWLMTEGFNWPLMTYLFFFATIHLFTMMKNNLINISEKFDEAIRLDPVKMRNRLFNLMLLIMMGGWMAVVIVNGQRLAIPFLSNSFLTYLYVLVFITVSFGSINIVKGYLAPIVLSFRFWLPLVNRHPNYLGIQLELLEPVTRNPLFRDLPEDLSKQIRLARRVVVDDDFNWYEIRDSQLPPGEESRWIIRPVQFEFDLRDGKVHRLHIARLSPDVDLGRVTFEPDDLVFRQMGLSRVVSGDSLSLQG
ncbi:MAG: PrsW family intramembrane metalloprotease [Bacteroidota bacterium]|nr:PrsW family intramembrane metalloprotease [Bacteroidota bacterium]MDX5446763.1 PrsW family intramembrane metalloprotease [Bacteroidota bacterium]MDX5505416.1 PrsW family intramembrane metalloprotease [Bacteroidota bacterium]